MYKMRLYEIDESLRAIVEGSVEPIIDEETGELVWPDGSDLDDLIGAREEALEARCVVLKEYDALIQALKAEKKALDKRIEAAEGAYSRLKESTSKSMLAFGEAEWSSPKGRMSFRRSESVEVVDIDAVPDEYKTKVVEFKADKTAIKTAIKAGADINGAALVTKFNLQVK